jgi:uncharacterized protein YrrD
MIKDFRSLVGAKILEFDSGQVLGLVSGMIIHPDTGMVEAFWVKPLTVPLKTAILKTSDILEFKKHLYVKDERVFAHADDIIRINEILDEDREFLGNRIQSETGLSYGKCVNLTFDTQTYALKQIYSRRSILGLITMDERIFSYNDIIRVLPEGIIVNDDSTKKEGVMASTPETAAG